MRIFSINLKNKPQNFEKQRESFLTHGLNVERFDAISDSSTYDDELTPLCRNICSNVATNIGLSHKLLSRWLLNNDTNPYAMILEDDALPIDGKLSTHQIEQIVNDTPPGWDIIQLHCDFICGFNLTRGSAAAYLISKSGQRKISERKIMFPAQPDVTSNFMNGLRKITVKSNIFVTDEKESANRRQSGKSLVDMVVDTLPINGEKDNSMVISYKILRLGNFEFTPKDIYLIILCLYVLFLTKNIVFPLLLIMVFYLPII